MGRLHPRLRPARLANRRTGLPADVPLSGAVGIGFSPRQQNGRHKAADRSPDMKGLGALKGDEGNGERAGRPSPLGDPRGLSSGLSKYGVSLAF